MKKNRLFIALIFMLFTSSLYSQKTNDGIEYKIINNDPSDLLNNYYVLGSLKFGLLNYNGTSKPTLYSISLGYQHFYNDKKNSIKIIFETIRKQKININQGLNKKLFPFKVNMSYLYQLKEKKGKINYNFFHTKRVKNNNKKKYINYQYKIPVLYDIKYYLNTMFYYNQFNVGPTRTLEGEQYQIQSAYLFLGLTELKFKNLTHRFVDSEKDKYSSNITEHSIGIVIANYHNIHSTTKTIFPGYSRTEYNEIKTKFIKDVFPTVFGIKYLWDKKYYSNTNYGFNLYSDLTLFASKNWGQFNLNFGFKIFIAN